MTPVKQLSTNKNQNVGEWFLVLCSVLSIYWYCPSLPATRAAPPTAAYAAYTSSGFLAAGDHLYSTGDSGVLFLSTGVIVLEIVAAKCMPQHSVTSDLSLFGKPLSIALDANGIILKYPNQ